MQDKEKSITFCILGISLMISLLALFLIIKEPANAEVLTTSMREETTVNDYAASADNNCFPPKTASSYASSVILPHVTEPAQLLKCNFYYEKSFREHIRQAADTQEELNVTGKLRAAILPHHLTAGKYIAAIFRQAATQSYDTVIFIAPNHTGAGGNIIFSDLDWETPYGNLPCNIELTEKLRQTKTISGKINNSRMQEDHSISGLIPYLAYYLPEIKTVSILLSGGVDIKKAHQLAELLAQEDNILVICSIDFSHYLNSMDAAAMDKETIEAIKSRNYAALNAFSNDNLDSPPTATAFMQYAENLELEPQLKAQSNSLKECGLPPETFVQGGITTYQIWCITE